MNAPTLSPLPAPTTADAAPTVASLLLDYLEREGVDCVFGIPGGPATPLFDELLRRPSIRTVSTRHESGAVYMAAGYAATTGRLGAAILTTGPGATNGLTAAAAAKTDSLPLLIVTAQVATSVFGKGSLQDSTIDRIGTVEMYRPATKFSAMLANPRNFGVLMRQALREAMSGRPGPVHIAIPTDMMKRPAGEAAHRPESFRPAARPFDRDAVKRSALALLEARRPAILAGHGVNRAGARGELLELAELLSIPTATTPKGKGAFPENHPLSLRVFGQASSPRAERRLLSREADALFVIGSALHEISTQGWEKRLAPDGPLLHCDVDPSVLGRNYPVTHALVGDAKATLRELLFEIRRLLSRGEAKRPAPAPLPPGDEYLDPGKRDAGGDPMPPQRLMKELDAAIPDDAVIFLDVGNHALWSVHHLTARGTRAFVHNWGEFAAMGTGVAGAIGGKLGAPGRPVVAIVGDGGFGMSGMEVLTAATYAVPVVWIVFNDGRFNTVHHGQKMQYDGRTHGTEFRPMDVASIARALGARGITVRRPEEAGPALKLALAAGGPAVLDVAPDSDEPPPILSRVRALDRFFAELESP